MNPYIVYLPNIQAFVNLNNVTLVKPNADYECLDVYLIGDSDCLVVSNKEDMTILTKALMGITKA